MRTLQVDVGMMVVQAAGVRSWLLMRSRGGFWLVRSRASVSK